MLAARPATGSTLGNRVDWATGWIGQPGGLGVARLRSGKHFFGPRCGGARSTRRSPRGAAFLMSRTLARTALIVRIVVALVLLQTLFFKFTGAAESVFIFTKIGMEPVGRIGSEKAIEIVCSPAGTFAPAAGVVVRTVGAVRSGSSSTWTRLERSVPTLERLTRSW